LYGASETIADIARGPIRIDAQFDEFNLDVTLIGESLSSCPIVARQTRRSWRVKPAIGGSLVSFCAAMPTE
jgi:hypothetical protein